MRHAAWQWCTRLLLAITMEQRRSCHSLTHAGACVVALGLRRAEIFAVHLRRTPLAADASLPALAAATEGYTGADITAVCRCGCHGCQRPWHTQQGHARAHTAASSAAATDAAVLCNCREAALAALEESMDATDVAARHFEAALRRVTPSVPPNASLLSMYHSFQRGAGLAH